jgi:hypothetical protein
MTHQVGMQLVQAVAGEDQREAALTLTAEGTKALAEAAPLLGTRTGDDRARYGRGARLPRLLTLLKAL